MEYIWKTSEKLKESIGGPKNTKQTIQELEKSKKQGLLHMKLREYQLKYGDNTLNSNIVIPYFIKKKSLVNDCIIINNVNDAERIAEKHIKKMANLKEYVLDSIISTTNESHWRDQRLQYNDAFNVGEKLELIPISQKRAEKCVDLLFLTSKFGSQEVNINEFLLHETQAQLQLALLGVSEEFSEKTNKKIREVFYGKNINYSNNYYRELIIELKKYWTIR